MVYGVSGEACERVYDTKVALSLLQAVEGGGYASNARIGGTLHVGSFSASLSAIQRRRRQGRSRCPHAPQTAPVPQLLYGSSAELLDPLSTSPLISHPSPTHAHLKLTGSQTLRFARL